VRDGCTEQRAGCQAADNAGGDPSATGFRVLRDGNTCESKRRRHGDSCQSLSHDEPSFASLSGVVRLNDR
jgi:hypothetical protein